MGHNPMNSHHGLGCLLLSIKIEGRRVKLCRGAVDYVEVDHGGIMMEHGKGGGAL
jgi:hypothetical protein